MTRAQLIEIVGKASTLFQRLADDFVLADEPRDDTTIQDRLQRWQERVADGDEGKWQQRLLLEGLDADQVVKALGPVRLADDSKLPVWAEILEEVIEVAASAGTDELRRRLPPRANNESDEPPQTKASVRFEAFVLPFLEVARRRLQQCVDQQTLALLSDDARASLEYELLSRFSNLCWQTLQWEFAIFRSTRRSSVFYRFVQSDQAPTTDLYTAFTNQLLTDGLATFFQRYPVLGRLMATRTQLWCEATAEFLSRLRDDMPRLRETFDGAAELGQVRSLRPGLSDPHAGGRMAVGVSFMSGLKLVYKPRNLGLEKAWFDLLRWLNKQGQSFDLQVIGVTDLDTHGWVEFVSQKPVEEQAGVRRFYQRVGMQMALLHILEGTDFHHENIIACGDQPVLIDLEMILHHRLKQRVADESCGADREAHELLGNSVLRSGLLPQWAIDRPGEAMDMSGLGSMEDNKMPEMPQLEHVNSDSMDVVVKRAKPKANANEVVLDGSTQSASDHVDEIVEGFQQTYAFLIRNRDKLADSHGPLRGLKNQSVRFVYRPTRFYGQMLQYTLQPRYLRDGVDRSIELEMLSSRLTLGDEREQKMSPLLRQELAALEQMDVPIFHARSSDDSLRLNDDQVIEACFREDSDSRVLARLDDLSEDDCRTQIKVIHSSLYSRQARHAGQATAATSQDVSVQEIEPLSRDEAIAEALAIGEELRSRAIVADDGSATWLGLELIPGAERWVLQPLGRELYSGTCGVALFLATLEKISGDRRFSDLAMGALESLRKSLAAADADEKIDDRFPIGGAAGLGSHIYTLVRISQLLDNRELLKDASRAAMLLKPERVDKDESLDVIAGASGAILGLLALHDAGGDREALERAISCGQHLLDNRTTSSVGLRAWKTIADNDRLLTGFSHGAAGNAYALLRLFAATGDEQYKHAAADAIDYERTQFSAEQRNWRDLRELDADDKPHFMVTWCHGAPGIGLARLGGLSVLDTPQVHQDIEAAITTTMNCPVGGRDHLCCGTMGRSDILLSLARGLARPELETRAQQQAAWVIRRARRQGYTFLDIEAGDAFVPGMFVGLSGVGYALLRLADPDKVPSVLLWN